MTDGNTRAVLTAWWRACLADPSRLPDGIEPVQSRLIRAVGRGELPGVGPVYLKLMGFPRGRDRLRYSIRTLPAEHEAAMLQRVAAIGCECPEVIAAFGARRWGLAHASLLVTRALVRGDDEPTVEEMAAVAARLASGGIYHPDLNPGNFVRTATGSVAVLDFQSARPRSGGVGRRERVRMAAKLCAETGAEPRVVAAAGLCSDAEVETLDAKAASLRRRHLVRLIRRCLTTSSEFESRRGFTGRLHTRRGVDLATATRVAGGRELRALWIGDRALEMLDGREPILAALFAKSWWCPGAYTVYIPAHAGQACLTEKAADLLEGFRRFRQLLRR